MTDKRIILDLCGGTGAWSAPYREAGYDVRLSMIPSASQPARRPLMGSEREHVIYRQSYRKPYMRHNKPPLSPFAPLACRAVEAALVECGKIERGGKTYEFHLVRFIVELPDAN